MDLRRITSHEKPGRAWPIVRQAPMTNVENAVQSAEAAFEIYRHTSRIDRAAFLRKIADEIELRGDRITEVGHRETALPTTRLEGERGRTTGQLRLFATHIEDDAYLDFRHDPAMPDRAPLPRPDLRLWQVPVGPVAVFGASNFPLAFSVAGGDTASALAAGCSVVVKGHPAHPGTGKVVAEAIETAIKACDMPAGIFSLVEGEGNETGAELVTHPLIQAVGFTGSLGGGRALFDLCAKRPNPIPFFGELGSVNPVFLLPSAVASRAESIGQNWADSLTMGVGQFCTNPGVAVSIGADDASRVIRAAADQLRGVKSQTMLTDGIANAFRQGVKRIESVAGVEKLIGTRCEESDSLPYLFVVPATLWLQEPSLHDEIFGPLGLLVVADDESQMLEVANGLEGQLTATLQHDEDDQGLVRKLLPILERKAGRLISNGYPTGVEVCDAMVHGGPYPASTNFGATSVGTLAIRRFLRPVCYQDFAPDIANPK